jgi:hypothetical protein
MRAILVVALALLLPLGSSASAQDALDDLEAPPAEEAPLADEAAEAAVPAEEAREVAVPAADTAATTAPNDFRIGFWEFDFVAVDHEPRGTTFRLLDFKIFKLLEVGQGPDYQSFRILEVPELFTPLAVRREGESKETRIVDVQAISLALFRQDQESAKEPDLHILMLPVVGSVYSVATDYDKPDVQQQTVLFVIRQDMKQ